MFDESTYGENFKHWFKEVFQTEMLSHFLILQRSYQCLFSGIRGAYWQLHQQHFQFEQCFDNLKNVQHIRKYKVVSSRWDTSRYFLTTIGLKHVFCNYICKCNFNIMQREQKTLQSSAIISTRSIPFSFFVKSFRFRLQDQLLDSTDRNNFLATSVFNYLVLH